MRVQQLKFTLSHPPPASRDSNSVLPFSITPQKAFSFPLGLTAIRVRWPLREVGERAGLAGEAGMVMQKTGTTGEAILRVTSTNLRTRGMCQGG